MAPETATLTGRIMTSSTLTSRITSARMADGIVFNDLMKEMRLHYKSPKRNFVYSVPVGLKFSYNRLNRYNFVIPDEKQKSIIELKDSCNNKLRSVIKVMERVAEAGFQNLQQTKNIEDFKKRMEEGRKQAKEEANQAIDSYYDQLIQEGEKYPELQPVLVQTGQGFSSCLNNILQGVRDFLANIIAKISEWVTEAWDKVKEAWEAAKNFVSDCYNDAKDFVSDLF